MADHRPGVGCSARRMITLMSARAVTFVPRARGVWTCWHKWDEIDPAARRAQLRYLSAAIR